MQSRRSFRRIYERDRWWENSVLPVWLDDDERCWISLCLYLIFSSFFILCEFQFMIYQEYYTWQKYGIRTLRECAPGFHLGLIKYILNKWDWTIEINGIIFKSFLLFVTNIDTCFDRFDFHLFCCTFLLYRHIALYFLSWCFDVSLLVLLF